MTPFDIFAALAVGTLSGMGVGGGGLLVIYLTLVKNISQIEAQATNLIFFLFAAFSSLLVHLKKRTIDKKTVAIVALCGIAGSYPGVIAASAIGGNGVRKIFGIMLLISGVIILLKPTKQKLQM